MSDDPNGIFRSMFRPSLPDHRADPTSPALRVPLRTYEQAMQDIRSIREGGAA
jgi:hypothetical protein